MSDATVTVAEIAAAMGRKPAEVELEAAELGMLLRKDWAERTSLSVDDARGLASGEARAAFEHHPAWRQHQIATKAWVNGRRRAIAEAAARVRSTAGSVDRGLSRSRPGRPDGSTRSAHRDRHSMASTA
jgi:hypothetical protein